MEDNKVESKYPQSIYGSSHQQEEDQYEDNVVENEVVEDDELADEEDENERDNGFSNMHEDDNLHDEDDEVDEDNGVEDEKPIVNQKSDNVETERHPKKRRLKNLISNYEFAPRSPASSAAAAPSVSKPSFGGRNSLTDWTEHETLVLLDAWGDRFLQRGRKSLRSEEWQEVAEKVSEVSKIERTDAQCRNRLDTLKKKYKKEKTKLKETYATTSRWDYFKKMDMLMSSSPQQGQGGLSCGLVSGEYVFMNPRAYLNRANGLDEMRDSPGNSNSAGEEDSDELPPKRAKNVRNNGQGPSSSSSSSYKLLADSILNFSKIYEKVESSRRQQMKELEKMRLKFHKELEIQKKEIMERAKIEIAEILQLNDEESNVSTKANGE